MTAVSLKIFFLETEDNNHNSKIRNRELGNKPHLVRHRVPGEEEVRKLPFQPWLLTSKSCDLGQIAYPHLCPGGSLSES
jgi:hypothetical protein